MNYVYETGSMTGILGQLKWESLKKRIRIRIRIVYWWKAKMTIPHQGIGRGRSVPSSHKGSKFRYTIVRQFSRGDERIREDIPVPDSLGKETFLVGIFTSSGNLKDQ